MRIKYQGSYSLNDLTRELEALVDDLREKGIDQVGHLNLYFQPLVDREVATFRDQAGQIIDTIVVNGRVARAHTTTTTADIVVQPNRKRSS